MRRCQRLPELTHPVDSARPPTYTSNPVPTRFGPKSPILPIHRHCTWTLSDLQPGREDTTFRKSDASTPPDRSKSAMTLAIREQESAYEGVDNIRGNTGGTDRGGNRGAGAGRAGAARRMDVRRSAE